MNADRLLALHEMVAEAPDAVLRLRRFVLDLAMRGKLVPQEAGDEPASELLKRIAAEKARLVKAGEVKKPKPLDPVAADEKAFLLPYGWTWARLGDIAVCLDYMRKPINSTERDRRIEGKAEDELFPYYGATQQQGWIDDYIFDEELVLLGEDGVPFFDPYRSKAYIISGKTWVNNHAHVFKGILISHPFLAHYLNVFDFTGRVVGATRSKLNQARAVDIPVPLPPLAEQRRIVAKMEELMALLDRLEAARTEREATRDRLTAASLARLTAPDTTPEDFPANARFALATLPALTTRPDQSKPLRQTILNLAVRGKLVKQDPTNEPASELLKRIATEKARLFAAGEIRRPKPLPAVTDEEQAFNHPQGWVWTRLAAITVVTQGFAFSSGDYSKSEADGPPLIKIGDIGSNTPEVFIRGVYDPQYLVQPGDLLLGLSGSIKCSIWRGPVALLNQRIARIRPASTDLTNDWLFLIVNESIAKWKAETSKLTVQNIKAQQLNEVPVPLPPLAEQHRIVAKVDALLALCDRLEAALTIADTTRAGLLDALIHKALVPDQRAELEAAE